MKIKILGIEMKTGQGISLADMFQNIKDAEGDPMLLGDYNRFTYIDSVEDFHVGLIITTKDHNKFLEFKRDKNNAKLEARDVTPGSQLADFNFFAINKKNGKGVYQYYHHSCSINLFGTLCKKYYEKEKLKHIENEKNAIQNLSPAALKNIKKKYAGTLKCEILVRQESFDAMVKALKSIQAVTLSVSTLAYKNTIFTPIALEAKNMSQRFSFAKNAKKLNVVSSILKITKDGDVQSAKVEGIGEDGLEQIIKMFNTPDQFGERDFDDVAGSMTISPIDFAKSDFLKWMIEVAKEQPVIRENGKK